MNIAPPMQVMMAELRFENFINKLTPAKRSLAKEAVQEYLLGESESIERLSSAEDVWKKAKWLTSKPTEHFVVYYMKGNFRLISQDVISCGGLDAVIVDIRVLLRKALLYSATRIICVHNHPSGYIQPSSDDDKVTERVKEACKALDVSLVDHVIVTGNEYYSYKENGRI